MFRIRTALAGAAVAVVALLTVAAPASAHDELVSTSPAFDEQLTTAPEQVVLTFSDDVLQLSGSNGTAMTVVDESGADWVAGDPVISADTVTVPLKSGMPNGDFTVTWKIVSSDGHPTSGEYAFSLAAAAAPTPAATTPETTQPSAEPSAPTSTQSPSAEAPSETDAAPWPLLIGLGVVLLAAIVIVVVISARKRRS